MTGAGYRLLFAGLLALLLHAGGLFLPLSPGRDVLPTALPVQSISVSLNAGKKSSEPPVEVEPAPPAPPPAKVAVTTEPAATPHRQAAVRKPAEVKKRKAEPQAVVREKRQPPPAAQTLAQPPFAEPETVPDGRGAHKAAAAAAQPAPEHDTAHVIQQATPLYRINPPPKYPRLARRRSFQGMVLIEALIDISGRVTTLKLISSSGHSVLDRAALQAVRRWRFTPGKVAGQKREMWVKVPVRFQLN